MCLDVNDLRLADFCLVGPLKTIIAEIKYISKIFN